MKYPDDFREVTINTYGKPIKNGPNGEERWTCYVVEEDRDRDFMYIYEDGKHKLFTIHSSNLNAGPCSHWIYPDPIFIGENNVWDLYNQMSEKGIFRKREDGIGYYHYK